MEPKQDRVLRPKETAKVVGLSARRIRQLDAEGNFPPHIQLGARAIGYLVSDIETWIQSRKKVRRHD